MAVQQPGGEPTLKEKEFTSDELVLKLSKYLLLLGSLVATVTYAVGFSPPGGVWQDTDGHLAGEPIIRDTHYRRYLLFFYSNAAAFASSLVVIVLMLLLDFLHKNEYTKHVYIPLRLVLLLGLLSLMVAYAAGTCRDMFTVVSCSVLVAVFFAFLIFQMYRASMPDEEKANPRDEENVNVRDEEKEKRIRKHKVLMVLATFAVSVTYVAGLSTPGGFWDSTDDGGHYRPGDSILKDHHNGRLSTFFVGNTTAFAASLQIIVVLLDRKLVSDLSKAHGFITVALLGLIVAYVAGSCRETDTTVYLAMLVAACIAFQIVLFILHILCQKKKKQIRAVRVAILAVVFVPRLRAAVRRRTNDGTEDRSVQDTVEKTSSEIQLVDKTSSTIQRLRAVVETRTKMGTDDRTVPDAVDNTSSEEEKKLTFPGAVQSVVAKEKLRRRLRAVIHTRTKKATDDRTVRDAVDKARSLVLLLATLAATITYTAGLNPPGGLWQENGAGHMAGDPILLTTNARRYKTFFYCNS